jgi:hypothetical protein
MEFARIEEAFIDPSTGNFVFENTRQEETPIPELYIPDETREPLAPYQSEPHTIKEHFCNVCNGKQDNRLNFAIFVMLIWLIFFKK